MLCFIFAVLIVLLDQFIKRWILLTLALHESMELIPGVVGLTHVENTGAAFSILENQRWLLIGIAVVAALLLIAILLRYNDGFWSTLGLAAVLGGTLGNLADRVLLGYVVDIFELQFMNFAIFNIADIFITLGGITFLIHFIVSSLRPAKSEEMDSQDTFEEYEPQERPQMEDEIGLYDFQYGEDIQDREPYEFDGYPDSDLTPGLNSGLDPGLRSGEHPDDLMAALDALDDLSDLNLELLDGSELEEFNLDDLLREYGFEDDAN